MADEKLTKLSDPASALASYLDDLLHIATDTALQEDSVVEAPKPAPTVKTETPVETAPPVKMEARAASLEVAEKARPRSEGATPPVVDAPKLKVVARNEPEPQPEAVEPPSRPDWSGASFECLIFTVAGLQLAVPLILLGAIHRIEEEIRPIPGSPRWYMGIRPDRDKNLRVVDTAEWIMAGRVPDKARDNYKFVIRLDNSEWGLACDDVAQSFTLRPDEVRWRTTRSKRPWLAGTVIEQMCALIDVRAMADLLVRAEREHHLDLN